MNMAIAKIKLSDNVEIHFRAYMDFRIGKINIGTTPTPVKLYFMVYERRVDDAQTLVMPPCLAFPPEFHGCLTAAAQIIKVANSENLVYEGDQDVVLRPRQIIQSVARNYDVDPSAMMARYGEVRPYLLNTLCPVPYSLETVLNNLKLRGGTYVQ